VRELNRRGKAAGFFPDTDQIIDHLAHTAAPGDVILVMSNGGFDNIHERLESLLLSICRLVAHGCVKLRPVSSSPQFEVSRHPMTIHHRS
jgi:hypothetical protein